MSRDLVGRRTWVWWTTGATTALPFGLQNTFAMDMPSVAHVRDETDGGAVSAAADLPGTSSMSPRSRNSRTMQVAKSCVSLVIPLTWNGAAYVASFRVEGTPFRAVVDTGSPFLTVPGTCRDGLRQRWGCYRHEGAPAGLDDTFERYEGRAGTVQWRRGTFVFYQGSVEGSPSGQAQLKDGRDEGAERACWRAPSASSDMDGQPSQNGRADAARDMNDGLLLPNTFVFGVVADSLMGTPGGVFLGLIKHTLRSIRPSFLGQTSVRSFAVDLSCRPPTLTLSSARIPSPASKSIALIDTRRFGDVCERYCARVRDLSVNGSPLRASEGDGVPVLAIFDTGVTGCVVDQALWEKRFKEAKQRRERSLWRNLTVAFRTAEGELVRLRAEDPITTQLSGRLPWPFFQGHVIVVGLAFLEGRRLTIDAEARRAWLA